VLRELLVQVDVDEILQEPCLSPSLTLTLTLIRCHLRCCLFHFPYHVHCPALPAVRLRRQSHPVALHWPQPVSWKRWQRRPEAS